MDSVYEVKYHRLEDTHWWFRARRKKVLDYLPISADARYLDIGCSSGQLLEELIAAGARPEHVYGVDISEVGIEECRRKGLLNTQVADATNLFFPPGSFDYLIASDCLEHIEHDQEALRNWFGLLRPGGQLVVFVPAFMSLWSPHDLVNHHFRRYERGELRRKLEQAGFRVVREGFWNATLFLPIYLVRRVKNLLARFSPEKPPKEDLDLPNGLVNSLLYNLLSLENRLMRKVRFPAGVSTFCIAQKPG